MIGQEFELALEVQKRDRPLYNPLNITHIRACIAKEACENGASTLAYIGDQDSCLANADSLAQGDKVILSVLVGNNNLRR